jgi:UDP-glucose 4-epimerase
MKILLTGGSGFIGTNLIKLFDKKDNVIIFDKKKPDYNLKKNWKFFKIDLNNKKKLNLNKIQKFDIVLHLAAFTNVSESIKKPNIYLKNNINITKNILDYSLKVKAKYFFQASSASCYSDQANNLKSIKETSATKPASPYALSKLKCEKILFERKYRSLKRFSLRFFNVFSDNLLIKNNYNAVISSFLLKKIKKKPLIIYGDGRQTRDFIHTEDIYNIIRIIFKKKIKDKIFNVGSGTSMQIKKLALLFSKNIKYKKAKKGEIRFSKANIEKLIKLTGYKPKINLQNKGAILLKNFKKSYI